METTTTTHAARPRGVNLTGYLRDESGWGAAGRGYARALQKLDLPVALQDISAITTNRSQDPTLVDFDRSFPYDINLMCIDPSQHFAFLSRVDLEFFEGRYNVGLWAWELPQFPASWFDRFAYYDEIWATTSFVVNAVATFSPVPVVRIPPVLLPQTVGSAARGRSQLRAQPEECIFLFTFDFHSHLQRKNPLGLIDAFRAAFRPADPVRLIIKTVNARSDPVGFEALRARAEGCRIQLLDGYWPLQEMRDLMAACDAYVSLHRSEGTGLTITDAMAAGKPVIATGWSGNMDFMNISNSFPVRFELVELKENVGPYRAGGVWAEPSIQHAAELMRYVFENREHAAEKGRAARRDVEAVGSEGAVAKAIRERLEAIEIRRSYPSFRQETLARFQDYRRLIAETREIVCTQVPVNATVIVISKGDDDLVKLEGRTGWHFPQTASGVYAGYHPSDSREAIEHLEALRARGGQFLLLPNTAFWWLDYYREFGEHLRSCYPRIWNDETCQIFQLSAEPLPRKDGENAKGGSVATEIQTPNGAVELRALAAEIERLANLEIEVSVALRSAEAQARPRQESLMAVIEEVKNASERQAPMPDAPPLNPTRYAPPVDYPRLIAHIRQTVRENVPSNAIVLVVSKGDAQLLKLPGRTGWHFPQNELGIYAGYYPPTGAAAVSHLEALRAKGANYLLLPSTAFWWLDYYAEFRDHLAALYRKCWQDDECTIFELAAPQTTRSSRWGRLWRRPAAN